MMLNKMMMMGQQILINKSKIKKKKSKKNKMKEVKKIRK